MTESEETPERRIRDLVRKPDRTVGRIRLGSSTGRAPVAPTKITQFRLTFRPTPRRYCPICMAWEGSAHLGRHPYWRRVVAALARYAR